MKYKPIDETTEKQLLGCLIQDGQLYYEIVDELVPEDFYGRFNQEVYKAIQSLVINGQSVDHGTVANKLELTGAATKQKAIEYVSGLIAEAPMLKSINDWAKIIKDKAKERALLDTVNKIANSVYEPHESADELLAKAESEIFDLGTKQDRKDVKEVGDLALKSLEKIHEINDRKGKIAGLPSGLSDLDNKISGLKDQDLIILAARPSMGKTSLALNIAAHASLKEHKNILIFSLEMSSEQLIQRMIFSESLISGNKMREGTLTDTEFASLRHAANELAGCKMGICDTPGITLGEIHSICRRRQLKEPLDLVVIDYMQLITLGGFHENRQQEVSMISRGLKQIAREIDAPVICLSQLSRSCEMRMDKRPMLSDLRDSGAIEQDADIVMFLYRDSHYNEDALPNEAEINIAKNRNGPVGKVIVSWVPDCTRFLDREKEG